MVISSFLKISKNLAKWHSFSFLEGTTGYGTSAPSFTAFSLFFSLAFSILLLSSLLFFSSFSFFYFLLQSTVVVINLESTDVVIHLANRIVAYPAGFIEDVLVRVGELIFPVDFYVLNICRNLPFGGSATRDSRERLPRKEYARSRHQRLFEKNIEKTGKDVVFKL